MTKDLENRLFALSDTMALPATFADPDQPDCPLVHCNPEFERLTGYAKDDVIGRNCRFLQGAERQEEDAARLRAAILRRSYCTAVLSNRRADGTRFNNFLLVEPITLPSGRQIMMGCHHEFQSDESLPQIIAGSQTVIANHEKMHRHFSDMQAMSQDALQMRSETAILMVKNYLLKQNVAQRHRADG